MDELDRIKQEVQQITAARLAERSARLQADLEALRAALTTGPARLDGGAWRQRAERLEAGWGSPPTVAPARSLLIMDASPALRDLDRAFTNAFDLGAYFSSARLSYPTVYCESLEEFFSPLLAQVELSPQARAAELARLVDESRQPAAQGGDVLGYNLPGQGAYLNGWLFGARSGLTPRAALHDPAVFPRILATAAHEKLGHGFLSAYSALGAVSTRLGLSQEQQARRFGLQSADTPANSLRRKQAGLIFQVSQFLEEGWATWIETWTGRALLNQGQRPRYDLEGILRAAQGLQQAAPEGGAQLQAGMLSALAVLFGEEETPPQVLQRAMIFLGNLGEELDEYFMKQLNQPLRYALGELLCSQAAFNLGARCVPYAALIAAAVSFDPAQVSLGDLRELLGSDPNLHPDARLAAISRLTLAPKDDPRALGDLVANRLSLSAPRELQT